LQAHATEGLAISKHVPYLAKAVIRKASSHYQLRNLLFEQEQPLPNQKMDNQSCLLFKEEKEQPSLKQVQASVARGSSLSRALRDRGGTGFINCLELATE